MNPTPAATAKAPDSGETRKVVLTHLLLWFLFTVIFTVSPLFFNYLLLMFWNRDPTVADVVKNGELYLIATALTATALGEMILALRRDDVQVGARLLAAFGGICVIGLSVLCYGALQSYNYLEPQLKALQNAKININRNLLFASSWLSFFGSMAVGIYASVTSAVSRAARD